MIRSMLCYRSSRGSMMVGLLLAAAVGWGGDAVASPGVAEIVEAAENARIAAIKKASRPTIAIFAAEKSGGGGSGVLISPDGFALTNFHVAQPCGIHMKCGLNDGELYDAVIVGIDPTGDVALIKLMGRDDFPIADIADSDRVRVGDECFAVGNPFLLATDLNPTVTYGVVSGVRRYQPPAAGAILEYTDCIQTDAAINPGNSGGPLFNANGKLIGINGRGSFEKRGRVSVGVGYAISINQIKRFLGLLHSGRIVNHATLGATATTDEGSRVVVTNILESCDAYRRGLRYGDQLVSLAERPIDSANTLKNVLGILPKGWRVPLSYRRDGQEFATYVRLPGIHSTEHLLKLAQQEIMPDSERPLPEPPSEDQEHPEPQKQPQPPRRQGRSASRRPQQVAEEIRDVFQARRGYANYHFNRTETDRVWQSYRRIAQFQSHQGRWVLSGRFDDDGRVRISLDDQQVFAQLATPNQTHELAINMTQDLAELRDPQGSGGLYLALYTWRRLLTRQLSQFGETYYWGTAPLPGHDGYYDVLVGIHDVVESRFYFSPETGQLVAMEMFPDANVDPAELYFDDFRPVNGQSLPYTIRARFGDHDFGTLRLDDIQLESLPREDA